jgi:hypothetical protein
VSLDPFRKRECGRSHNPQKDCSLPLTNGHSEPTKDDSWPFVAASKSARVLTRLASSDTQAG